MTLNSKLGVVLALLAAASMWFYVQHIVIGHQLVEAKAHDIPRGNLSDLYPRWLGTRELLLHHSDPYSAEITREIQVGYYGRAIDASRRNDPKDQQRFAYPLYVVFLLAPTVKLPFSGVQLAFFWLLFGTTVGTIFLWRNFFGWRASCAATTTIALLTLGSFQVLQGLKLQQLTLLVAGLIAAAVALIAEDRLIAAGFFLALATIKPQLVLILTAWLVLWAIGDWVRRRNLLLAFALALTLLVGGAEFLMPGWIGEFRSAISDYRQYNDGALSVLQILISPVWGTIAAALAILATAGLCWRLRRVPASSVAFGWITSLVLAVTILVIPKTSPYNHILLLPGIMLSAQHWRTAWEKNAAARMTLLAACFIVFWPWVAAFGVVLISLFAPLASTGNAWIAPLYTSLAVPFAVCAVLAFNLRELAVSNSQTKPALTSRS